MLHVVYTRLHHGHLSVCVGDCSRHSEQIIKNLKLCLSMRLLLLKGHAHASSASREQNPSDALPVCYLRIILDPRGPCEHPQSSMLWDGEMSAIWHVLSRCSGRNNNKLCPMLFSAHLVCFFFTPVVVFSICRGKQVCFSFQAIDDDCNQTGQMTAALLDWPQVSHS